MSTTNIVINKNKKKTIKLIINQNNKCSDYTKNNNVHVKLFYVLIYFYRMAGYEWAHSFLSLLVY